MTRCQLKSCQLLRSYTKNHIEKDCIRRMTFKITLNITNNTGVKRSMVTVAVTSHKKCRRWSLSLHSCWLLVKTCPSSTISQKAHIKSRHRLILQTHFQSVISLQIRRTSCYQALYGLCQSTHTAASPTVCLLATDPSTLLRQRYSSSTTTWSEQLMTVVSLSLY